MEEGFIISNKIRKAVFIEISSGEKSLTRIAKKHHLIEHVVESAAKELEEHGIIEEKNGGYELTEMGKKLFGKLKGSGAI
ncbi:transcriptional regulator [Thermoplasmatales archaeon ex4484_30]|nr:MAG: transcriptional regulator [Thermoplasmata archaeon]OYT61889.1 MAG: transcriptional regulator [Thermoplasmatales archaeon ex4484_30]